MERVTLLGSTGSIGVQTLDVIARHPERFQVYALTACSRWQELARQCLRFSPRYAALAKDDHLEELRNLLKEHGSHTEVVVGAEALEQLAADPESGTVVAAIVGAAGVKPTLSAVTAGKKVLLANKEALVVTGALFMNRVREYGATLLPVDSEHNAIFQCLPDRGAPGSETGISKLVLTASGGPFRTLDYQALGSVTPEQAVQHPNWSMGKKISVDSATMMNKGLELIEACWLFDMPESKIEIVVHPQSVIHSMVEYVDGSVLAQLGSPDMRTPIANALGWPERIASGADKLNFYQMANLSFEPPDETRFPCLKLAREVASQAGGASVVLNAANEVAVTAFLEKKITFMAIPALIRTSLDKLGADTVSSLEDILALDVRARDFATALLSREVYQ